MVMSLNIRRAGALLLSGLFFYDIFWVFGTPVMVSVAKSLDAPIKLLFPRPDAAAGQISGHHRLGSKLGLGLGLSFRFKVSFICLCCAYYEHLTVCYQCNVVRLNPCRERSILPKCTA